MKNKKVILGVLAALVIVAATIFATNPAIFQGRLKLTPSAEISIAPTTPIYKTIAKGVKLNSSNPVGMRLSHDEEGERSLLFLDGSENASDHQGATMEIIDGSIDNHGINNDMASLRIYDKNYPDGKHIKVSNGDRLRLQDKNQGIDYYLSFKHINVYYVPSVGRNSVDTIFDIVQKNR